METQKSPFGDFHLNRWPAQRNDTLKPWDAADEYLLDYTAGHPLLTQKSTPRVLLVNDSFGALACALHRLKPVCWSDSMISRLATEHNYQCNELQATPAFVSSIAAPGGSYDLVLIRIPKSSALLEDQLCRLRAHLHSNTVIVAAAMIKHLPRSAFGSFEKIIGPLTTSLARKKARLIFATLDESLPTRSSPYPDSYSDQELGLTMLCHANVFSRQHLDHGARFFLNHFDELPAVDTVVDLGCGNGVLGIVYQQQHRAADVRFVDESFMAIASAESNYQHAFGSATGSAGNAVFDAADGLSNVADNAVDLVLCNPPFHQQYVVGGQVAAGMFRDAKRCLQRGGELWVVANRHLAYQQLISRMFGNCRQVAVNKKFSILRAIKR